MGDAKLDAKLTRTEIILSDAQQSLTVPKKDNISLDKKFVNMTFQHESNDLQKVSSKNQHGQSHGLGHQLWLSATLSWAKASIGPSPMAQLGLA
jgi:hypothetical protein